MDGRHRLLVEQLVRRIKSGERKLIVDLHPLISASIRYIALKYLHNVEDADELIQDFWAEIDKILDKFHYRQYATAYFCAVAKNKAIHKFKELHSHDKVKVEYVKYSEICCDDLSADKKDIDLFIMVEQALDKLTPPQRIVIQTMYFEDKSLTAIASELKISVYEVCKLRDCAMRKLGIYLQD